MSATSTPSHLPSAVRAKLRAVRLRHAVLAGLRAVASAGAVLLAAMLIAMTVDWLLPFQPSTLRVGMTSVSIVAAIAALLLLFVGPVKTALGWDRAAEAVDARLRPLQERWSTVASLATRSEAKATSVERAMAAQVRSEAAAMERIVVPSQIAPPASTKPSLLGLAAGLALVAALWAVAPLQFSTLLQRFWSPRSEVTATQLTSVTGDRLVPRGEKIDLVTQLNGVWRSTAQLSTESSDGELTEIRLSPFVDDPAQFVHTLRVDETMAYRVRSGDGQTAWHTLQVIDYPEVAELLFEINFPDYTNREPVVKDRLPRRIKVVQGSQLTLALKPKETLETLTVSLSPIEKPTADDDGNDAAESSETLLPDADGWYRFAISLSEDILLESKLVSPHGLANERRLFSRIDVIQDNAPVARITNLKDDVAVAIDEQVEIEFEAHDDFGIAKAELVIYDESKTDADGNPQILSAQEIPLGEDAMKRHINGRVTLDIAALDLPEGSEVSYAVRVSDNRQWNPDDTDPNALESRQSIASSSRNTPSERSTSDASSSNQQADSDGKSTNSPAGESSEASESDQLLAQQMLAQATTNNQPQQAPTTASTTSATENASEPSNSAKTPQTASNETTSDPNSPSSQSPSKANETSSDAVAMTGPENNAQNTPNSDAPDTDSDSTPAAQVATINDTPNNNSAPNQPGKNSPDQNPNDNNSADPNAPSIASNTKPNPNASDNPTQNPQSQNGTNDTESMQASKNANAQSPTTAATPNNNQQSQNQQTASNKQQYSSANPQERDEAGNRPPMKLTAQTGDSSQQDATTRRQRLRITERLASLAEANDPRTYEANIRETIVEIDDMLAQVEEGLHRLTNRSVADSDRPELLSRLDDRLGEVETFVANLREETREGQFAFVGLQMVDITRTHVTPARDFVFTAIQKQSSAERETDEAHKRIVRAREMLAALLKRYDQVERERRLQKSIDDAIKVYEVYVEKRRVLLREAQQNRNPLERKMEIIEVDQEYLDRLAEVIQLRRAMLDEFAEMLGDDPRLLSRFLELSQRRGRNLRDRLSEISQRQYELFEETAGWLQIDPTQQADLWTIIVELRLNAATGLAEDTAIVAERLSKQMPLEVDASTGTPGAINALSEQAASLARTISFDADSLLDPATAQQQANNLINRPRKLVLLLKQLSARLDQLLVESDNSQPIEAFVQPRLLEVRALLDQAEGWQALSQHAVSRSYSGIVAIEQHQQAIATEVLRVEMLSLEQDLNAQFQRLLEESLPAEITALVDQLHELMETITFNQLAASWRARSTDLAAAGVQQQLAVERIGQAEELFDRIRREVVARLDEAEGEDPNIADLQDPTLDDFLARLEREPDIVAQLGIPNRRRNLRILNDLVIASPTSGGNMLSNSTEASGERARQAMQKEQEQRQKQQQSEKPQASGEETEEERERIRKLQEDLEQALVELQKQQQDANLTEEQRQQLAQLEENLKQLQQDANSNANGRLIWQQIVQSDEARAAIERIASGQTVDGDSQWNKLMSKLDDGLWQVRGKEPPDAYREAIEQYQDQIRQLIGDVEP